MSQAVISGRGLGSAGHGRRSGILTAVELLAIITATAFAGHALAGKPPVAAVPSRAAPSLAVPSLAAGLQPVFGAPGMAPRHILWLYVNDRWRAVPA